ncbi:MAG: hypothetical protein ACKO8I_17525 [Cyanobacteriota bacterium]
MHALSWNPLLSTGGRPGFEAWLRHQHGDETLALLMRSSLLNRVLANPLPLPRRQELEEVAHGIRVDVERLSTTINQVRELT